MNIEVYNQIKKLADDYSITLGEKVAQRIEQMQEDDNSHCLIYRVLGVCDEEGKKIDVYQNKGRFLYKYAGAFLEQATIICMQHAFGDKAQKIKIENTMSARPKTFEIDCLVNNLAHEIKWRDATTDGDHITKEHTRVQVIKDAGYIPIRVMFYYPNRAQAIKIQQTLQTLYHGVGGQYYFGDNAWNYIKDLTGIDLLEILEKIASSRE
ncbi:MAG: ApaLI family restriction endonuclease [Clostridia bacterium]